MKKLIGPVIAAGAAALVLVPGVETLGNLGPGHSSGYLYKHIMSKLAVSAPKSRDNLFSPEQSSIWSVDRLRHQKPLPRPAIQARKTLGTNPSSDLRIGTVAGGFALRRRHMIGGPAIHKQISLRTGRTRTTASSGGAPVNDGNQRLGAGRIVKPHNTNRPYSTTSDLGVKASAWASKRTQGT